MVTIALYSSKNLKLGLLFVQKITHSHKTAHFTRNHGKVKGLEAF